MNGLKIGRNQTSMKTGTKKDNMKSKSKLKKVLLGVAILTGFAVGSLGVHKYRQGLPYLEGRCFVFMEALSALQLDGVTEDGLSYTGTAYILGIFPAKVELNVRELNLKYAEDKLKEISCEDGKPLDE